MKAQARYEEVNVVDDLENGFKNRTGEKTGNESGSRTSGPTGVGPVVEPVTS